MASATTLDVDGRPVRISSPDKVVFPDLGLTKLDIAQYALAVGEGLLAGLRDRPTAMERWPDGVADGAESFYQKHAPRKVPEGVTTARVTFPSGRHANEVAPADLATVLWMVNLNTLRFHPWPVRATDTEAVDLLRIDLDPQPGTGFEEARHAAHGLREVLADAGLEGWVKTSGGRGLHVYAPIQPVDFIAARHATIAIGRELARRDASVTVNWWKEERGERVFVDYNQMARDRLMASPYSIRPVPEARVSMPLDWQELDAASPDDFTVATAPARFAERGDAWAGLAEAEPASLEVALGWWEQDPTEMPYPPDYPKMPGEPARVQPSRARPRS